MDKLTDIDDEGRYLFIYSDKHYIVLFFLRKKDNVLYKITSDKYLGVEYIDPVDLCEKFNTYEDIKFFKPTNINGEYAYTGAVLVEDVYYRFSINNDCFEIGEEIDYQTKFNSEEYKSLKNIRVKAYVQKKNLYYMVGYEVYEDHKDPVYCILNTETDRLENIYYLYSDLGDIELNTINTDTSELKVFVGGSIKHLDNVTESPYFETFVLRAIKKTES